MQCLHRHGSNDELTTMTMTPTRRAAGHCMDPKQSGGALLRLHRQLPQTVRVSVTPRQRAMVHCMDDEKSARLFS